MHNFKTHGFTTAGSTFIGQISEELPLTKVMEQGMKERKVKDFAETENDTAHFLKSKFGSSSSFMLANNEEFPVRLVGVTTVVMRMIISVICKKKNFFV